MIPALWHQTDGISPSQVLRKEGKAVGTRGRIAVIAGLLLLLSAAGANADTILDPLHGCVGATLACADNGVNTPTSQNPPHFAFSVSPGPQTGDFRLDVLVPNNEDPTPLALSFAITGTQGGATNTSPLARIATLFSGTAWTSGFLDAYLGISASPANPIGAYLGPCPAATPCTHNLDPGATGFFVYQVDLGTNRLQPNPSVSSGPLLDISPGLPLAAFIVGFLNVPGTGTIATANSGAIFETGLPNSPTPAAATPEPGSLLLLGSGLVGLSAWRVLRPKTA